MFIVKKHTKLKPITLLYNVKQSTTEAHQIKILITLLYIRHSLQKCDYLLHRRIHFDLYVIATTFVKKINATCNPAHTISQPLMPLA